MSSFPGKQEKTYAEKFLKAADANDRFGSKAAVDEAILSASDLEALRFARDTFGHRAGLVELTHEYPEWKSHAAALKAKQVSRVRIAYEVFIENHPAGVNPCHPLTAAEQEDRREALRGLEALETKWN